jgi:hypothetical protein
MIATLEREKQILQNLLTQVGAISKKYHEIAKITGENFNVFRVLKIHSDEVKMHSALLAELLNPEGTHGQGDIFLKLFIEHFNGKVADVLMIKDFHYPGTSVMSEKYIGEKTAVTGGRIDLLITDGKNARVIIENKIYAADQENQLIRYHNFDIKARLCYLTLDGKSPSDWSSKNEDLDLKDKVILLSYKHDIVTWLEACLKESVKLPILRETITQYINLIKHLTNQNTNHLMEKEIMDIILRDKENLNMAREIACMGDDAIKREILIRFVDSLVDIKQETGFSLSHYTQEKPIGYPETILKFSRASNDKLSIAIEFENYDHLDIGVCKNEGAEIAEQTRTEIFRRMGATRFENSKMSDGWPWYTRCEAWDKSSWWSVSNGEFKRLLYQDMKEIALILGDLLS